MRISFLRHLSCPARRRKAGVCGGRLRVEPAGEIPPRAAGDDPDELLEGSLVCEVCESWYPVFAGVAVLVPDPLRYLRERFSSLMSRVGVHGDLSADVRRWMAERHFELYDSKRVLEVPDSNAALHYERVAELMAGVPLPASFRAFLEEWSPRTPYDLLVDMAQRCHETAGDPGAERIAVDAGCGVGGLVGRLAPHYDAVLGVDLSFSAIFMARTILLQRPVPYRHLVRSEREVFHPGNLDHARRPNVEMLVADCTVLPFATGSADAVASANVIDILHPRTPLREARRVIRDGGLLLFTDPFKFQVTDFGAASPPDRLAETKGYLAELGMSLREERDFVPWIWYEFQRQIQIYFNYCAVFQRLSGGEN